MPSRRRRRRRSEKGEPRRLAAADVVGLFKTYGSVAENLKSGEKTKLFKLAEAFKGMMDPRASQFVKRHHHVPILCAYQGDDTSLSSLLHEECPQRAYEAHSNPSACHAARRRMSRLQRRIRQHGAL